MLKVASYNIHKAVGLDRVYRPDRIFDVLAEIDADVIALQEADRRFGARASALPPDLLDRSPWRPVALNRHAASIGWHGNAILVRHSFEIIDAGHVALPTVEPRGAVIAEIRTAGTMLRIVGMHLDLSGLRRRQQAHAVCMAVAARAPMPTVLMGDLNEWSLHGGCLREFSPVFRIAPTGPSFHSRRPLGRLDRIMASHTLTIAACGVHHSAKARRASDHLPIWARLEFAATDA
ncbi:MAG: endonuclease/exonuclease/phosphatase family protein [Sphingomonadaceae bacterium]